MSHKILFVFLCPAVQDYFIKSQCQNVERAAKSQAIFLWSILILKLINCITFFCLLATLPILIAFSVSLFSYLQLVFSLFPSVPPSPSVLSLSSLHPFFSSSLLPSLLPSFSFFKFLLHCSFRALIFKLHWQSDSLPSVLLTKLFTRQLVARYFYRVCVSIDIISTCFTV